jgi:hypothetical protein
MFMKYEITTCEREYEKMLSGRRNSDLQEVLQLDPWEWGEEFLRE